MKILVCYGTRPEFIKIQPLLIEFKKNNINFKTLFTGQHLDLLKNENPDFKTSIKETEDSNRLDSILQSNLNLPDKYFEEIDYILIQGDTSSALALALAAFHRKIKIIHLEAGLRTNNLNAPYPEEGNRQLISRIASIHFCPTLSNKKNLIKEKCNGKIYVVGNTVLDNLNQIKQNVIFSKKVLITLHRRENHKILDSYFIKINEIAEENSNIKFLFPLHPNPNVQKHKNLLISKNIQILNPLSYNDMLEELRTCMFFISDSGGIQEEASFLNKRVIICREFTERMEAVDSGHNILCKDPNDLKKIFIQVLSKPEWKIDCPFGNGYSSEKIVKILLSNNNYLF
jgi:UDP-N-acetylglucosamine 2-epimerase (non-hydrolysing)